MNNISLILTSLFVISPSTMAQQQDSTASKATSAIQNKQFADALKLLEQYISGGKQLQDKRYSLDQLHYAKATALFEQKKYAECDAACQTLIKDFADSDWKFKAIFLRAESLVNRKQYDKAMQLYEEQATRLFSKQRKVDVANELIRFAEAFTKPASISELNAKAPDYQKAYKLYKEVLDIECGLELREKARFQMIEMLRHQAAYSSIEKASIDYLLEFDPSWRGKIGSTERVTLKKNLKSLATGANVALVRLRHAEALHRLNRRPEADSYLFELIKLAEQSTLKATPGLIADATWLRLHALRAKGGAAFDIEEWKIATKDYLKKFPKHLHADKTAFLLGAMLQRHGQYEAAIEAHQKYISGGYGTANNTAPLTAEKITAKALLDLKTETAKNKEKAMYSIGNIYQHMAEFDKAREAWNKTISEYPNGSRWAQIQKSLAELDYKQLIHQINTFADKDQYLQITQQTKQKIDNFIQTHPLDSRVENLLYIRGNIPLSLAKKVEANSPNEIELIKKLQLLAIDQWSPLLSKYPKSAKTKSARFLTASLHEEKFGQLEKAIEIYQELNNRQSKQRIQILKSKQLVASSEKVFKVGEQASIKLDSRNIEKVKVHQYWVDMESYFLKSADLSEATKLDVDLVEPDKTWEVSLKDFKKYQLSQQSIPIPFPQGKAGVCIVKIEGADFVTTSIVMKSDIDIALRSSRNELIAFAKNWQTDQPANNVKLLIADGDRIIAEGKTDRNGIFHSSLKDLASIDNFRILAVSKDGTATCNQSLRRLFKLPKLSTKAWFQRSKQNIRLGDSFKLTGVIRDAHEGAFIYPDLKKYKLSARIANTLIKQTNVTLSEAGKFTTQLRLPTHLERSASEVVITLASLNKKDKKNFRYSIPLTKHQVYKAKVNITLDNDHIKLGDIVTGKIVATHRWGAPVTHRKLKLTLPSGKSTTVITDDKGIATFQYDTTGIASGSIIHFSADITSIETAGAIASTSIDPLELQIRAEADKQDMVLGEQLSIDLVAKNANSIGIKSDLTIKLIKQVAPMTLDLVSGHSRAIPREQVVREIAITTDEKGKASTKIKFEEDGIFTIRIEGLDANGKPSFTQTNVNVLGKNSVDTLSLYHHNEKVYDDGTATLQLFSKLDKGTKGLMTIETESIVKYSIIDIKTGLNTIKVPLQARYAPVFRCSIMTMDKRKFISCEDTIAISKKLNIKTTLKGVSKGQAKAGSKLKAVVEVTDSQGNTVPAILLSTLNPNSLKNDHQVGAATDVYNQYTPFIRPEKLTSFSMTSSCGFSHLGSQEQILAALLEDQSDMQSEGINQSRLARPRALSHLNKADRVRRHFYKGEGFYNLGLYDQAQAEFDKVLRIDPYSQMARRWQTRLQNERRDYHRSAYDETRARLLTEVDRAWEVVPSPDNGLVASSNEAHRAVLHQRKLNTIIIPRVDFQNATLDAVLSRLSSLAKQHDVVESSPSKKGLNIVVRRRHNSSESTPIRIRKLELSNVPLGEVLRQVCLQCSPQMRVKVEEYAIAIVPASDMSSTETFHRMYNVPPDFLERIQEGESTSNSLKETFQMMGIKFDGNSNARFIPATSQLSVTNTATGLSRIQMIISQMSPGSIGNGASRQTTNFSGNVFNTPIAGIPFSGNVTNTPTGGLRSGDTAITRDSIHFFLNNPTRTSQIKQLALQQSFGSNSFDNYSNRYNTPSSNFSPFDPSLNMILPDLNSESGARVSPITPANLSSFEAGLYGEPVSALTRINSLPSWSAESISIAGKQEIEIPLPKQAGEWKLMFKAIGKKGRVAEQSHDITTIADFTIKPVSQIVAIDGDTFKPTFTAFRKNSKAAEEIKVVIKSTIGKKVTTTKSTVTFKAGDSNQLIELKSLTAKQGQTLTFEITLEGKDIESKYTIPVRAWGAATTVSRTIAVKAGQPRSYDLKLAKDLKPSQLEISFLPSIDHKLIQLATSTNDSALGLGNPCYEAHPAGKLLALTAIIDHLKKTGAEKSNSYTKVYQLADWSYTDLMSTMKFNGSWSLIRGRRNSDITTTAIAYEAINKWRLHNGSDTITDDKTSKWLQGQYSQLSPKQNETRSLIQQALSHGKSADFSLCNRLFRDRGSLSPAGKIFLAEAFINLERPAFAKQLIEALPAPEQWTSQHDFLTNNIDHLKGRALSILAQLKMPNSKLSKQLYSDILGASSINGFTNDITRGVAVQGLALTQTSRTLHNPQNFTSAKGKGSLYLNDKVIAKFDTTEPFTLSRKLFTKNLNVGINKLKLDFQGQGSIYMSSALSGFTEGFKRTPLDEKMKERRGITSRRYYHEGLSYKGKKLASPGRTKVTNIEVDQIVNVFFQAVNTVKSEKETTILEHIPAGFKYVKGSLRGGHSGARLQDGELVISLQDTITPRWYSYQLIATQPGTWKQKPTLIASAKSPSNKAYGFAGSITVNPKGQPTTDAYVMTKYERRELATKHFENKEYSQAEEHLKYLRTLPGSSEEARLAQMTLWIETSKAKPNAKLVVEAFETLDIRMPELSIPFEKILKVGNAYGELHEYERANYVYSATIDAGFTQDSYVAVALDDQGRFLDSIDYQKGLWKLYPNSDEVNTSWFVMAQRLFEKAPQPKRLKQRIGAKTDDKLKATDLIHESIDMLQQFLTVKPAHVSADQASYTIANAFFSLKDYKSVVEQAESSHKRYKKSPLVNNFKYMQALGLFWQRDYDKAIKASSEVAKGDSDDRNLASFITAQIYHAKGQPAEAIKWYKSIENQYPDAAQSIAYFEQKKISLDEVKVIKSNDKAQITLNYRNIDSAKLKIYRVDLMKLYLKQRNLSDITKVQLAGIAPKFEIDVKLGTNDITQDQQKTIELPIKNDGAYLIICRGDYLYSSGLVLITPLKMEVQERPSAHALRVNIKDRESGQLLDNVHVKAIGSQNSEFLKGETDLRGIWSAANIKGNPTVIARDKKGRYAFFRSKLQYTSTSNAPTDDPFGEASSENTVSGKVDYTLNLKRKQKSLNQGNWKDYDKKRRHKGKGIKVNKALKK